jgi:hypothetical protein
LHALADWLPLLLDLLGSLRHRGGVRDRQHAGAGLPSGAGVALQKVRGAEYCGYCAAKKEKFFGWRLHLIVTPTGIRVSSISCPRRCTTSPGA